MVLGVVSDLLVVGLMITLMFKMAVLALLLFVAVTSGRAAYETGAGALGAIVWGSSQALLPSPPDAPPIVPTPSPTRIA